MDKFVKADDVKDLLNGLDSLPWEDEVENMVDELVVNDVREVIHAKWEWFDAWEGDDTFGEWMMLRCSNCLESEGARENAKFCSNCGAIMDLD